MYAISKLFTNNYFNKESENGIMKHAFWDFIPDERNKDTSHIMADIELIKLIQNELTTTI